MKTLPSLFLPTVVERRVNALRGSRKRWAPRFIVCLRTWSSSNRRTRRSERSSASTALQEESKVDTPCPCAFKTDQIKRLSLLFTFTLLSVSSFTFAVLPPNMTPFILDLLHLCCFRYKGNNTRDINVFIVLVGIFQLCLSAETVILLTRLLLT